MDTVIKKRFDQAWEACRTWITEIDGSPTITLLVNAPASAVMPGLREVAGNSEGFRITIIETRKPAEPQFVPLETLEAQLTRLSAKELAELSANYTGELGTFKIDIRVVIYPVAPEKMSLMLEWWNDQVFLEDTEERAQFETLMAYFFRLQELFSAHNLFISPETGGDPVNNPDSWVEI